MDKPYHTSLITLHWLTLVLLVAVYALIELRGLFPKGTSLHDLMKTWHFMLGLTVLGLVAARLSLRQIFPAPPIVPDPPAWQTHLAHAMHVALYVFLIVMPLLGWMTLSAKGRVIPLFGLQLPALLAADKTLATSLQGLHEWIGTMGYWLIGLHAAAALWHHYVLRDNTLERMSLRRRARRTSKQAHAS